MDLHRLYAAVGIAFSLALTACQAKTSSEVRPADPKINSSFSLKAGRTNGAHVCIKTNALEKHFLLFSQARSSETAGQWMLFEPQIIFFKRSGQQMGLFEANLARIYDDVSSEKLLQTFTVTTEDADGVCFDWNYGLQTVVVKESMGTTDKDAAKALLDGKSPVAKVIASFVDDARIENNQLNFRQMARLRQSVLRVKGKLDGKNLAGAGELSEQDTAVTLEMRIRPYNPNKSFPVLKSKRDRGYGYFTNYATAPGSNQAFEIAQRWDTSAEKGLIKFRLSKNIPADLLPAAIDGLEYWNRVAGRKILEVETNVDPKSSLQEHAVMVHWVDWKDAGFAYAGYQADPLTGEILQGQLFLTSSWRAYGDYYENLGGTLSSLLVAAPEGARALPGCRYHHDAFMAWENLPMVNRTVAPEPESGLQLMIKSVISHEAGHVLGLRHNFAASFYSGKSADELAEKARTFLKDGTIEAVASVTSVMDYPQGFDELMMAKYIGKNVLEWDQKAIHWGYNDHTARERLDFCTDEELGETIGCAQFDSSSNPLLAEMNQAFISRSRGVWMDHAALMGQIFPNLRERNDVEDILNSSGVNPGGLMPAYSSLRNISRVFAADDNKIHSVYALKDWEHPERVLQLQTEALEKLKAEIGFTRAFDLAFPWDSVTNSLDLKYWERQLTAVVSHPKFKNGTTKNGVPYALTDTEAHRIQYYLNFTMKDLLKSSFSTVSAFLPGPQLTVNPATRQVGMTEAIYGDSPALAADMPKLVERVSAIMKSSTEKKVFTVGTSTFTLPLRHLDPRLFSAWTKLFKPTLNKNATPAHAQALVSSLKKDLAPVFASIGMASPETVSVDDLKSKKAAVEASWPIELRTWVDGELARIEAFEKL